MYTIDLNVTRDIVRDILAAHQVHSICFVGCGASYSELYPAHYFLTHESRSLRSIHYTAADFNTDTPAWLGEGSVVVAASFGGTTPETVEAARIAHERGAVVIAVTRDANAPLAAYGDFHIIHRFGGSYAMKVEKMGFVIALAMEFVQQADGYAHYDDMVASFDKIFDLCQTSGELAARTAREFAEEFKDEKLIYFMSSGASERVAYSSAICFMMEMQWVNASSFSTGEYFHGPFEITEPGVPFVLLMNDGKTRSMDKRALAFLQRIGAKVAVVDALDYNLSNTIPKTVCTYFNPMMHTALFGVYARALGKVREHPLSLRRYMWKLEY